MKTRNSKLQKTEMSSLISLFAIVAAVLVQSTIVTGTERTALFATGTEAYAELLTAEHDADMNIESWMLNENNFFHSTALETVHEASLEMESWMVDARLFMAETDLAEETEEDLGIAEWMTDARYFLPALSLEADMENKLEVENWMIEVKNFEAANSLETETETALYVEEWMLDNESFFPAVVLETETEDVLELESWMTNVSIFNTVSNEQEKSERLQVNNQVKNEKDFSIEYKDAKTGYVFLVRLAEAEEQKLELENWMVDNKHWIR